MLPDNDARQLQETRNLLHKLRTTNLKQTLQAQFFSSIGDANQCLRLVDFLPHVFLYLKDTLNAITLVFIAFIDSYRRVIAVALL